MADPFTIAAVATLAGTAVSAVGTIAAGKSQQAAANYEAAQLDAKGKEEQAAAQREAQQLRKNRDLALSQLQARAAASGFSATDSTTTDIGGEIAAYGDYQSQLAQYGGASRRKGYEASAYGRRVEGKAARTASYFDAASTIIGGFSSMAGKYGAKGPPGAPMDIRPAAFRYG